MLQAKFYSHFKDCENCLLIIGNLSNFRSATAYYSAREKGSLWSPHCAYEDVIPEQLMDVYFDGEENANFAKICETLGQKKGPSHQYFNISHLPQIEFLISCGEYEDLPE